jgi:hypothetical protein
MKHIEVQVIVRCCEECPNKLEYKKENYCHMIMGMYTAGFKFIELTKVSNNNTISEKCPYLKDKS